MAVAHSYCYKLLLACNGLRCTDKLIIPQRLSQLFACQQQSNTLRLLTGEKDRQGIHHGCGQYVRIVDVHAMCMRIPMFTLCACAYLVITLMWSSSVKTLQQNSNTTQIFHTLSWLSYTDAQNLQTMLDKLE